MAISKAEMCCAKWQLIMEISLLNNSLGMNSQRNVTKVCQI